MRAPGHTESLALGSLLGLVLSERNLSGRAARVLEVGRRHLDEEAWPGLAFQARLGLAFELARLGQSADAFVRRAVRLGGGYVLLPLPCSRRPLTRRLFERSTAAPGAPGKT